jgi:hypothetical protein
MRSDHPLPLSQLNSNRKSTPLRVKEEEPWWVTVLSLQVVLVAVGSHITSNVRQPVEHSHPDRVATQLNDSCFLG